VVVANQLPSKWFIRIVSSGLLGSSAGRKEEAAGGRGGAGIRIVGEEVPTFQCESRHAAGGGTIKK
jgi:hypothetical protein